MNKDLILDWKLHNICLVDKQATSWRRLEMFRTFDSLAFMSDVKICDVQAYLEEHTWKWKHWTYVVSQDDSSRSKQT